MGTVKLGSINIGRQKPFLAICYLEDIFEQE